MRRAHAQWIRAHARHDTARHTHTLQTGKPCCVMSAERNGRTLKARRAQNKRVRGRFPARRGAGAADRLRKNLSTRLPYWSLHCGNLDTACTAAGARVPWGDHTRTVDASWRDRAPRAPSSCKTPPAPPPHPPPTARASAALRGGTPHAPRTSPPTSALLYTHAPRRHAHTPSSRACPWGRARTSPARASP